MKKKRIIYFAIALVVLASISFSVFLQNTEILIENFNYKTYKTEIENNEMIILKDRHILNNKIYGYDFSAPKGIYIYYNPEDSEYTILMPLEIFTTNNETIFWKLLDRNIPKVSEQNIYLINICSQDNTKNFIKFREKLNQHFENYDLCTCGSDGWIEFVDENNFINKLKIRTNSFYY